MGWSISEKPEGLSSIASSSRSGPAVFPHELGTRVSDLPAVWVPTVGSHGVTQVLLQPRVCQVVRPPASSHPAPWVTEDLMFLTFLGGAQWSDRVVPPAVPSEHSSLNNHM